MKLKRTHTIKALLFIYLCISAAVCIALPSHLSDAENDSDVASISSAPLDLPPDIQQRIEEDLNSVNDTPEPETPPETDQTPEAETPPETDQEPESETPSETDQEPEAETPSETDQEPEPETSPETNQEPESETPPENTAYISTKHAGASVNLRAAANSSSEIVTTVYDKDEVIVLSESNKWYEIQAGDVTGYIYQDYLVLADE